MRFQTLLISIVTAGLITNGLALPSLKLQVRDDPSDRALTLVHSLTSQTNEVSKNVNAIMHGLTANSPLADRQAASKKVAQQFGTLTTSFRQALADVNKLPKHSPALAKKQLLSGTGSGLLGALGDLVNLVQNLVGTVLNVLNGLGLGNIIGDLLSVLSSLVTAVVSIIGSPAGLLGLGAAAFGTGTILGGVGSILGGIGSIIPG